MQVLFILLFIFFLIGVPIAIVLGFSSLVTLEIKDMPLVTLAQKTFEGMDSFTLLAIPFFILAGTVMTTGGISRRLMDFAKDRKSTRLNSSHVAISYAVFCLKKKNEDRKDSRQTA